MAFVIVLSVRAQRFLDKLSSQLTSRIQARLARLQSDPVPSDAKFLGRDRGEKVFRYRIGDHRVLYTVDHARRQVVIAKIDKRSRAYL